MAHKPKLSLNEYQQLKRKVRADELRRREEESKSKPVKALLPLTPEEKKKEIEALKESMKKGAIGNLSFQSRSSGTGTPPIVDKGDSAIKRLSPYMQAQLGQPIHPVTPLNLIDPTATPPLDEKAEYEIEPTHLKEEDLKTYFEREQKLDKQIEDTYTFLKEAWDINASHRSKEMKKAAFEYDWNTVQFAVKPQDIQRFLDNDHYYNALLGALKDEWTADPKLRQVVAEDDLEPKTTEQEKKYQLSAIINGYSAARKLPNLMTHLDVDMVNDLTSNNRPNKLKISKADLEGMLFKDSFLSWSPELVLNYVIDHMSDLQKEGLELDFNQLTKAKQKYLEFRNEFENERINRRKYEEILREFRDDIFPGFFANEKTGKQILKHIRKEVKTRNLMDLNMFYNGIRAVNAYAESKPNLGNKYAPFIFTKAEKTIEQLKRGEIGLTQAFGEFNTLRNWIKPALEPEPELYKLQIEDEQVPVLQDEELKEHVSEDPEVITKTYKDRLYYVFPKFPPSRDILKNAWIVNRDLGVYDIPPSVKRNMYQDAKLAKEAFAKYSTQLPENTPPETWSQIQEEIWEDLTRNRNFGIHRYDWPFFYELNRTNNSAEWANAYQVFMEDFQPMYQWISQYYRNPRPPLTMRSLPSAKRDLLTGEFKQKGVKPVKKMKLVTKASLVKPKKTPPPIRGPKWPAALGQQLLTTIAARKGRQAARQTVAQIAGPPLQSAAMLTPLSKKTKTKVTHVPMQAAPGAVAASVIPGLAAGPAPAPIPAVNAAHQQRLAYHNVRRGLSPYLKIHETQAQREAEKQHVEEAVHYGLKPKEHYPEVFKTYHGLSGRIIEYTLKTEDDVKRMRNELQKVQGRLFVIDMYTGRLFPITLDKISVNNTYIFKMDPGLNKRGEPKEELGGSLAMVPAIKHIARDEEELFPFKFMRNGNDKMWTRVHDLGRKPYHPDWRSQVEEVHGAGLWNVVKAGIKGLGKSLVNQNTYVRAANKLADRTVKEGKNFYNQERKHIGNVYSSARDFARHPSAKGFGNIAANAGRVIVQPGVSGVRELAHASDFVSDIPGLNAVKFGMEYAFPPLAVADALSHMVKATGVGSTDKMKYLDTITSAGDAILGSGALKGTANAAGLLINSGLKIADKFVDV